jgi:hypothetical protein
VSSQCTCILSRFEKINLLFGSPCKLLTDTANNLRLGKYVRFYNFTSSSQDPAYLHTKKTIHNPSGSIALLTDYRFNAIARFSLPGRGEFDERLVVDVESDDVKTDLLALQHRDVTVLCVRQPAGRLHQSDCQDLRQQEYI